MFGRGGGLSAPRLLTFAVSLILAILAVATLYTRVPYVGAYVIPHRFWVVVAAYVILALGVILPGL